MESKRDLIEKIIREQDLVCIYTVNAYNKSLNILEEYSEENGIMYSDLGKFILDNPQILDRLSTKNLMNLLSDTHEEDKKKMIVKILTERLKSENLFCEDIENNAFMKIAHSSDRAINRLGEENVNLVISQIKDRLSKTKGTNVENIASHLEYINDATNFLEYFEQGVFDEKKISLLEKMLEKDKNALRYVNFGIFKDDIFDIGEDFIEYISKFTALSAQMLVIANHNPKLLEILSQQISTYESLADNFDEMEVLITYFARKCFDINLTKDINANDLMECAFRNSTSLNPKIKYEPINVQFGENYQDRLQQEYSKRYGNASNVDEKLNLYLDRVFSITKEGAERFIKEYGSDIENIKGVNEEEKNLIYQLKEANAILIILFEKYFASKSQKQRLKTILIENYEKEEERKRSIYNEKEMFKTKIEEKKEETGITKYRENIISKCINAIKAFWRKIK